MIKEIRFYRIATAICVVAIFLCTYGVNTNALVTSNKQDIKVATKLLQEYKTKLYNIPDYDKFKLDTQTVKFIDNLSKQFKGYFSTTGFEDFMKNRVPFVYGNATLNSDLTMKLLDMSFDKITEDQKSTEIVIDYTTSVGFIENAKKKSFKEIGQVIMKKLNNRFVINMDWISVSKELMSLSTSHE